MGRGRVELKRIENKINRQATFAKRRNGLIKKAQELSVLCEVEVALIIFSSRGKLFDFCSSPSMFKTLEKYKKGCHTSSDVTVPSQDTLDNYQEYLMLKAEVECLQRSQRNLLGTDLGSLSTKELGQLEDQVEMSLQQIRSQKTQLLLDNFYDLTRKEQILQDANKALQIKLIEATSANTFQSQSFLLPSECEPYLQFWNHPVYEQDLNNGINVQGWMIQNQIP